jgi:hypothetical protein
MCVLLSWFLLHSLFRGGKWTFYCAEIIADLQECSFKRPMPEVSVRGIYSTG